MSKTILIVLTIYLCASIDSLLACPRVGSYPDISCDGVLKVLAVGDSMTYGRGDLLHGNSGGYPLRLREHFLESPLPVQIVTFAKPGATCSSLTGRVRRAIKYRTDGITDADCAFVSCGVNEYYSHRNPTKTVAQLATLKRLLKRQGMYVITATIAPIRRPEQRVYVDQVNALLTKSTLRLDLLSTDQHISGDDLHPNESGYDKIAEMVLTLLRDEYRARAPREFRLTDRDQDGIYDSFERSRFGTDTRQKDSDDDGLFDGDELFTYYTDPRVADTDGDGVSDGLEVAHNTDPLDPEIK